MATNTVKLTTSDIIEDYQACKEAEKSDQNWREILMIQSRFSTDRDMRIRRHGYYKLLKLYSRGQERQLKAW